MGPASLLPPVDVDVEVEEAMDADDALDPVGVEAELAAPCVAEAVEALPPVLSLGVAWEPHAAAARTTRPEMTKERMTLQGV